jgi:aminoglycoside phosphotransferase (APT) family kinase protein
MADDHQEFLNKLHGTMITSPEVINSITVEATGNPIDTKKRIIAGEVNEVWEVSVQNGNDIIVRISHGEEPGFETERWAMEQVRKRGVPTPEVLLIKKITDAGISKTICVETKIDGIPISKISLDDESQTAFSSQIASVLEKIHRINLEGFSNLGADGSTELITFAQYISDTINQKDELLGFARKANIPPEHVEKAVLQLQQNHNLYKIVVQPTLTHGDFGADHILFKDQVISGIIDMENAKGVHISYDLAWWDYYWRSKIPTKMIIENLINPPIYLEELINVQGLRLSLRLLKYYFNTGNSHALLMVERNFKYYLAKF